ncbi:hypothetical protein PPYR_10385 [Photinus pyralis]|uniref:Uncharacterized protein n=1 Tax=Photinus pyralis TaxID=7054 RepID=A0A5N4AG87_PHOPY|nr:hypothetical protein PPYR_10385 [Photinus pyralis]
MESDIDTSRDTSIWQNIEKTTNIIFPPYLKNLMTAFGFDNEISISAFAEDDIPKLENFALTVLPLILPENCSSEEKKKYFGIFYANIKNFQIVDGHKKLLIKLINYYTSKNSEKNSVQKPKSKRQKQTISKILDTPDARPDDIPEGGADNSKSQTPLSLPSSNETINEKEEKTKIRQMCLKWLVSYKENLPPNKDSIKEIISSHLDSKIDYNIRVYTTPQSAVNCAIAYLTCSFCKADIKIVNAIKENKTYWTLSNFFKHIRNHYDSKSKKQRFNTLHQYFNKYNESESATSEATSFKPGTSAEVEAEARAEVYNYQRSKQKENVQADTLPADANGDGESDDVTIILQEVVEQVEGVGEPQQDFL